MAASTKVASSAAIASGTHMWFAPGNDRWTALGTAAQMASAEACISG